MLCSIDQYRLCVSESYIPVYRKKDLVVGVSLNLLGFSPFGPENMDFVFPNRVKKQLFASIT